MDIKFSPPDITQKEIELVIEALKSGWITTGPKTKEFERKIAEFCGTSLAVCLNSATAGLELTLKLLGVQPGDEVITSAYTYTASASVIEHVGAKIVLCDTLKDGYEMDYDKLCKLITPRTKVIIPVDIGGIMCDYKKLFDIVDQYKDLFLPNTDIQKAFGRIIILADAAHSFGAERDGVKSGNAADFSSFSFHAVKNLTTAEGGAVTWKSTNKFKNEDIYKEFMLWSLHGQSKDALSKMQIGSWEYDIVRLGQKCNMTDVVACIGLAQLERYPSLLNKRKEIITKYDQAFSSINVQVLTHYGEEFRSCGHLYLVRVIGASIEKRNDIITAMAKRGIACNVHYKPLPLHTAYKNLGFSIDNFPNAYAQYINEISLPLHTLLTDEEIDYITSAFIEIVKE